jgi:hypothetical protein
VRGFTCSVCGAHHDDELPLCFISPAPVHVENVAPEQRGRRVLLSSDQCVIDDKHFFILGNLDVPIVGRNESLRWSVWSSLSKEHFDRTHELWNTPGRENEPPYFGWLSSSIPGYADTVNVKVFVHAQQVGTRPLLQVLEQDHPLYRDHVNGISWTRACELSHAATD